MTPSGAPPRLSPDDARTARLRSLLLAVPPPAVACDLADDVLRVVTWFGALQGQDVRSLHWSLGVRSPGATVSGVRAALEAGTVVRTWPMRGTLHLVPARDARWMVRLMAGRTSTAEATRRRQLGLADQDVDRGVDLLAAALAGGGRLTRAQCLATLDRADVPIAGQAGYHLLAQACKRGVLCMTPEIGGEQTFALLDEWAPGQRHPDRDEALVTIALRYVRSHGPATRRDLAGWTGLTLGDVDRGVAAAGDQVTRIEVDGAQMLVHPPVLDGGGAVDVPEHLVLPGFDEFMLGYKDRSLLLAPEHFQAVVPGGNGMFRSTLVRHGRVVGTWTRARGRAPGGVGPVARGALDAADRGGFERALAGFATFLEVPALDVRW